MHEGPPRNIRKQETSKEEFEVPQVLRELEEEAQTIERLEVLTGAFSDLEKLPSFYDTVSKHSKEILGAVVFALAFQAGNVQAAEGAEAPVAMTESVAAKFEQALGYNAATEASKVGRIAVELVGENESPRIIVHVGQTHITNPETNLKWKGDIEKSQSQISQFLLATSTPDQQVFVEGHTLRFVDQLQELKEDFVKLGQATDAAAVMSLYKDVLKGFSWNAHVRVLLNKQAGEKLESLGYKEASPLVYFKKGSPIVALYETGLFPPQMRYKTPNATQAIIGGAASLLDINKQITMVPAETVEANGKSSKLEGALRDKGKELGKLFLSFDSKNTFYKYVGADLLPNISSYSADGIRDLAREKPCQENIACQQLATEILTQDIPAIERAVFIDRELVATKIIGLHAQTSEQKIFPLVYGSGHNFTEAVTQWNQQNPEYKFNLIKIK